MVKRFVDGEESLLVTIKRRNMLWFDHVTRHQSLCKTLMQDSVKDAVKRGRQHKIWSYIKNWTDMTMPEVLRTTANTSSWRRLSLSFALTTYDDWLPPGTEDDNCLYPFLQTGENIIKKMSSPVRFELATLWADGSDGTFSYKDWCRFERAIQTQMSTKIMI